MRKIFILATPVFMTAILLILFGCNHPKQFELSLKLDNAEGQSVFLCNTSMIILTRLLTAASSLAKQLC